jgi:hypothetical protein
MKHNWGRDESSPEFQHIFARYAQRITALGARVLTRRKRRRNVGMWLLLAGITACLAFVVFANIWAPRHAILPEWSPAPPQPVER